ncbi:MAG: XdhC/CoxI family protein [Bacteroidales bacterium]|jgi:xanthine dehydrogenase accessory factor|nr:XdhC/CoxI family protein [Bacteroidales bacterium]
MIDVLSLFQESKIGGQNAILCLITSTQGSTPRKIGSKMLVYADGSIAGSIGGGKIEHLVIQDALKLIDSSVSKSIDYDLSGDAAMQCGGKVSIYFEAAQSQAKLYIFGGGHIGKVLSRFANEFAFQVFLLDNRPEIMPENKIEGIQYLVGEYNDLCEELKFDTQTFVIATTHKHLHDEEIIAKCLAKPHAYLGMMASKRKAALARKKWAENSDLEADKIDKVYAPIGVPINCETPEEIAISVLAQLIDFKNKLDNI